MTSEAEETQGKLIAEQLGHTLDLIKAEITTLQAEQTHQTEMTSLRLKNLERQSADFEKRLRDLTESSTQFKFLVSLSVGGGLLSLIELVRSLLHL